MQHSAFRHQTPDEMYFGAGARVPDQLAEMRAQARRERLAAHRAIPPGPTKARGRPGGRTTPTNAMGRRPASKEVLTMKICAHYAAKMPGSP
jgi:hypothetical protein